MRTTIQGHPNDLSLVLVCDVTDRGEAKQSVAELLARFGHLDIVLSNIGWCKPLGLEIFEDDAWVPMGYWSMGSHPPSPTRN